MDMKRKKKVSKKNKKSWIKHIDNADVDDFIIRDNFLKSSASFADKKTDEDLFINDVPETTDAIKGDRPLTKKEKARLPFKCRSIYVNNCPIPDPVGKRTRVKSKEERQCRIRKSIENSMKEKGILKKKTTEALINRSKTIKVKRAERKKELKFVPEYDVWGENKTGPFKDGDTSWLGLETLKHHKKEVRHPKDFGKKKSDLPAVEPPHPGLSYNPSLKDHQALLQTVVEKEEEKLKEEAHIKRCTTDIFRKIKRPEKEARWMEEMSQGLVKEEEDDNQEVPVGPLSFNPPTSFLNKKTLKQRRKQKEEKEAKLLREQLKIEKKKAADIYKLKFIKKSLDNKEAKEEVSAKIRKAKEELNSMKTKRLSKVKFVKPDLPFSMPHELQGSLRKIKPEGNLLADAFNSLQRRNILAPSERVTRFKKAKVKQFTKPSHRLEQPKTLSDIQKAFRKKKVTMKATSR